MTPSIAEHAEQFRRDGFLLLEDVLDRALIERMHSAFNERHASAGTGGQPRGSLRVGDRRYMVSVRLKPPFTDPRLFATPTLLGVLTDLLGGDRLLTSFVAVVSQPGSEDQHVHADGAGLFDGSADETQLPPYAVTTIVPLVDMNDETGTTRVYPGSHRMTKEQVTTVEPHDPLVRRGSVLLMDYRLHHGGLRNRSTAPRPILSLVFSRAWWRDSVNFSEQPPLLYGPLDRRRMPPALRELLPPAVGTGIEDGLAATARRLAARVPVRLRR